MAPPSSSAQPGHATGINEFANDVAAQMEGFAHATDIAEEAIARDLEEDDSDSEQDDSDGDDESSSGSSTIRQYSMINSYRRPSYVNPGQRGLAIVSSSVPERTFLSTSAKKHNYLSKKEREAVREDERSLLRDNNLLLPKHPRSGSVGPATRIGPRAPSPSCERSAARLTKRLRTRAPPRPMRCWARTARTRIDRTAAWIRPRRSTRNGTKPLPPARSTPAGSGKPRS